MGCNSNIINVDGNVLVDALTGAHPNIVVGFAGYKTHVTKRIGDILMPMESTAM
jgi:hypothetical protein